MSILEELVEKYGGNYQESPKVSINFPSGKHSFQPQKGLLIVDGSKISISITEVSDAARTAEPFRITLYFDKVYKTTLTMYPKSIWNRLKDVLFPSKTRFIPRKVDKQFYIDVNKKVCEKLVNNKVFVENILNEQIYIRTQHENITRIILTPAYGINDVEHLEKFITVLKQIEKVIKQY